MGQDSGKDVGGVLGGDSVIDERLLDVLGCPLDPERPRLELDGDHLRCPKCGAKFPIVKGIPHLLPESAIMPNEAGKTESE